MYEGYILISIGFVIFFGFIIFRWVSEYFSEKGVLERRLSKISAGNILTCKDGDVVKLAGRAMRYQKLLIAPLSKRKCVYYRIIVEKLGNKQNITLIDAEKGVDFFLSDGSQKALVNTEMVSSYLIPDANYSSGFMKDATDELENYLKRHSESSVSFLGTNHSLRYYEAVIELDETIVVAGKAKWRTAIELGLPEESKPVLCLRKINSDTRLLLSNDPEIINRF